MSSNNRVTVTSIKLNRDILGGKEPITKERHTMYHAQRKSNVRYNEKFEPNRESMDSVKSSWRESKPIIRVDTESVAVNGMLNDFEKAVGSWCLSRYRL